MGSKIQDDMFTPEVIADPYAYYGRLRDEDPIHWNETYDLWVVTRHDDLVWLTRHHELFSSAVFRNDPRPPYPAIDESDLGLYEYVRNYQGDQFIQHDRPEHLEMRRVMHSYFTPKSMEAWRPFVQKAVKELLDEVEKKGRMDVMRDLATPLPVLVIAEMMGVPEQDRPYIRQLAEKLLYIGRGEYDRMKPLTEGMRGMVEYVSPLVDERIVNPGDDFISVLASGEKQGGSPATRCWSTPRSCCWPAMRRRSTCCATARWRLCAIPTSGPCSSATPLTWPRRRPRNVCAMIRRSFRSSESPPKMSKCAARRWASVTASDGSFHPPTAIRQSSPDPDKFDITRWPNQHVAFGSGVHHCLGATLARVEGQEVFKALAERFPAMRLENEPLEYQPSITFRSLKSLPISLQ